MTSAQAKRNRPSNQSADGSRAPSTGWCPVVSRETFPVSEPPPPGEADSGSGEGDGDRMRSRLTQLPDEFLQFRLLFDRQFPLALGQAFRHLQGGGLLSAGRVQLGRQ